jgi:two-component system, NtrC family, response regulator AtoC
MENIKPSILVADDESDILLLYKNLLKNDYNLTTTARGHEAVKKVSEKHFDLVILDVMMPEMNGIEALKKIKEIDNSIDVIMVTASKEVKPAVDCLKYGAFDYIIKPFEVEDLLSTIKKALERRKIIMENIYLKQALDERASMGELIGKNERIRKIYDIIENISGTDSTVFITGESGTGKEIVAETIHKKSKRANMPYIVVNCAAIPENLLESEMFGHERGAFTGALDRHIGKFELANGGTIFLDEIGEMPLSMQAKLLRTVQESIIERVGGERSIPIDIRVIAATNIDIKKAIQDKRFREDLFYRLNVIPIDIPPLRDRVEDIPLFINYFVGKYKKELKKNIQFVTDGAMKIFQDYSWPGNVRELENLIERIVTLSKEDHIDTVHIPRELINSKPDNTEKFSLEEGSLLKAVKNYERNLITEALKSCDGNQTKTARTLGIHRTTLISKLEAYGIKA